MIYRHREDTCPLCGNNTDLTYSDLELHDTGIAYPTACKKCGASWLQWYDLVYVENSDIIDAKGTEVD